MAVAAARDTIQRSSWLRSGSGAWGPTLPRAGHIGHPKVRTFTAHDITVFAPHTTGYADGERIGPLPVRATCVPAALRVLVPPPG